MKQQTKETIKQPMKDWPQWALLASLMVEQAITNFGFIEPLFGGYGSIALGLLWVARIGFVGYRAYRSTNQ